MPGTDRGACSRGCFGISAFLASVFLAKCAQNLQVTPDGTGPQPAAGMGWGAVGEGGAG